MTLSLFLIGADPTEAQLHMQLELMHNAFISFINQPDHILYREVEETAHEPCAWRGIRCTHGLVTSVVMGPEFARSKCHIEMDYLPSSLQFIHFKFILYTKGWSTERLPRELRYFCSFSCFCAEKSKGSHRIRMDKLPYRLEEMHIMDDVFKPSSGAFFISALPSTLRICHICHISMQKVFIDNDGIPDGIQILNFKAVSRKPKIQELHGRPLDGRVTTGPMYMGTGSRWFTELDNRLEEIS